MKTSLFAGIAFITALGHSNLHAQATWTSTTTGGDWATTNAWTIGGSPGSLVSPNGTDALIFDTASQNRTYTNSLTNFTASSITVTSGSRDNNVTGNAITLNGGVTVATGSWQTIQLNTTLTSGAKSFNITSGRLYYDGILSGGGGLTKDGGGTLLLSQQNNYSGGTIVNNGTLELTKGGSAGAVVGTVTVNSGAFLSSTTGDSFGYDTNTRVSTLNIVGGTVTHNSGSNLTVSSAAVNMTGGLMQTTGSGSFDFYDQTGTNTSVTTNASSNSATISGKINLRAGDNDTVGTVFTVANGGAADDLIVSANVVNGGAQGVASIIQKSGAGRMVLSGANTYTGGTILNLGTLAVTSKTGLGANNTLLSINSGTGSINTNSATLELATSDGTLTNTYNLDMGSDRYNTIVLNRATSGDVNYTLGTISLGSSTLTFNKGSNTVNGGANISALNLTAGNSDRPVILNGDATLTVGSASITSTGISKNLQLDGTSSGNSIGPITNTNNATGGAVVNVIKNNISTWTLTGTNTYTGTTNVNAGTLLLGSAGAISNSSAITLAGGTLASTVNGAVTTAGTLSLTASTNSKIDFGGGTTVLTFANSAGTWGTGSLQIWNWSSGTDKLFVGNTASLSGAQLAQVEFFSGGLNSPSLGLATQTNLGELVPVPEPTALASALLAVAALFQRRRRG